MQTHLPNMASRVVLHSLYLFIEFAQLHNLVKHLAWKGLTEATTVPYLQGFQTDTSSPGSCQISRWHTALAFMNNLVSALWNWQPIYCLESKEGHHTSMLDSSIHLRLWRPISSQRKWFSRLAILGGYSNTEYRSISKSHTWLAFDSNLSTATLSKAGLHVC